jgi:hypothetical protein
LLASWLAGQHVAREINTPAFLFVSAALHAVLAKYMGAEALELVPVKVV